MLPPPLPRPGAAGGTFSERFRPPPRLVDRSARRGAAIPDRARGRRRRWLGIHAFNLWFTLVSGLVFVSSGFAIWFQEFLADPLVDISYSLHVAFSWVLYVLIPLHLASAASRALKVVSAWRVSLRTYARDRFPDTAAIKNAETITEDLPCY